MADQPDDDAAVAAAEDELDELDEAAQFAEAAAAMTPNQRGSGEA